MKHLLPTLKLWKLGLHGRWKLLCQGYLTIETMTFLIAVHFLLIMPLQNSFPVEELNLHLLLTMALLPISKELLTEYVNLSDGFVILFDENFNSVTQSSEMDIIIPYWDIQAQIVRVHYWGSEWATVLLKICLIQLKMKHLYLAWKILK